MVKTNGCVVDRESDPDHPLVKMGYTDYSKHLTNLFKTCDPEGYYLDLFARFHDARGHGGQFEVFEQDGCIVVGVPEWTNTLSDESKCFMLSGVLARVRGDDDIAPLFDDEALGLASRIMDRKGRLPVKGRCGIRKATTTMKKRLKLIHTMYLEDLGFLEDVKFLEHEGNVERYALCTVDPYTNTVYLADGVMDVLAKEPYDSVRNTLIDFIVLYSASYLMSFDRSRMWLDRELMHRAISRYPWWKMATLMVQTQFIVVPPVDVVLADELQEPLDYPSSFYWSPVHLWHGVPQDKTPISKQTLLDEMDAEQEVFDTARAFLNRFGSRMDYMRLCRRQQRDHKLPEGRYERMLAGGPCGIYPDAFRTERFSNRISGKHGGSGIETSSGQDKRQKAL